jgi:hypothetical protein
VLTAATRKQMWAPVKLNSGATYAYGFGWELDVVAGHTRVQHGGSLPGFRSTIQRYVDDRLTVVVLTNADHADPGTIARRVAETYVPGLVEVVRPRTVVKVDPKQFDAYVGQYQPTPNVTVTVSREGDKLMLEAPNTPGKVELLAESDISFFPNDLPVTFTFIKDQTGKVTHLALQNGGREVWRGPKIK